MAIHPSDPPAAAVVAVKRAVASRVGNPKFPRSRLSTANRDAVFISCRIALPIWLLARSVAQTNSERLRS